jgi:hypothetical protein
VGDQYFRPLLDLLARLQNTLQNYTHSMAHRATYIEDVVEAIFSHFVLDANLASLSSVARSCQRFQLPALRLLWEDMDFVLLLRLFSNGIIQSGMLRNIGEIVCRFGHYSSER